MSEVVKIAQSRLFAEELVKVSEKILGRIALDGDVLGRGGLATDILTARELLDLIKRTA